jgi:sortase A
MRPGAPILRPVPRLDVPPSPLTSPAPPAGPWAHARRVGAALKPSQHPFAVLGRVAGSGLVFASVLLLGWGLWETVGSAVFAERAQQSRAEEFTELQASSDPLSAWAIATSPDAPTAPAAAPGLSVPAPMPARDNVVGRLRIPAVDVDAIVAVGTHTRVINEGPGLWEAGVVPGQPGNATIAGHRNTYGSVFYHLDKLGFGDRIIFEVPGQPDAVFEVRGTAVVLPHEVGVTAQGPGVRLTLTTCTPIGTAEKRLIVQAELVEGTYASQALAADGWEFRR